LNRGFLLKLVKNNGIFYTPRLFFHQEIHSRLCNKSAQLITIFGVIAANG